MSILQRFMCATTRATTIRHTISLCKTTERPFHLIPQLNASTTTDETHKSTQKSLSDAAKKSDWTVVYRLPIVRFFSAFNKLKVYQAAFTVGSIPSAFVLENADLLPIGTSSVVGAVGVSGVITLALCSLVVKNLIGFIYINRGTNQLKFAYVDYWGRRQDILVDIDDIVPDGAQEKPARISFYQKIGLHSNDKMTFKLLQRYGIIVQPDVFGALFY